jgi:hypothetical protein
MFYVSFVYLVKYVAFQKICWQPMDIMIRVPSYQQDKMALTVTVWLLLRRPLVVAYMRIYG